MLLIHDIVEIDAGDSVPVRQRTRRRPRKKSAKPRSASSGCWSRRSVTTLLLWEEFQARASNEARFAAVFDRMEPILQNYVNEGFTWKQNHVTYEMVRAKNQQIAGLPGALDVRGVLAARCG